MGKGEKSTSTPRISAELKTWDGLSRSLAKRGPVWSRSRHNTQGACCNGMGSQKDIGRQREISRQIKRAKLSRSGGRATALLPENARGDNECYPVHPIVVQRNQGSILKEGGEPCALKGARTVRRGGKGSYGFACPTLPQL